MKNDQYFKHDVSASGNKKLMVLMQEEGLRGYGAYWMLIETLRTQPRMRAPLKLLHALAYRLRTKSVYLQRIVENYGLFKIEDGYFFSPGLCKRMRRFIEAQEAFNTPESTSQDSRKSLKIKSDIAPNAGTAEKRREEKNNNSNSTAAKKPDGRNQSTPDSSPCLSAAPDQSIAVAEHNLRHCPNEQPPVSPVSLLARTDTPRATPRLEPIGHWNRLIDDMTTDEPWMQMVGMHSGLKQLYINHRPEIVELFRQHIRLYDKGGTLLRVQDVKQYFVNFLAPGGVTHTKVREHLLQMLRRQNLDAGSNPFETVVNGKRTYLGYPIPDDAPPRPDAQSVWDDETKSWRR